MDEVTENPAIRTEMESGIVQTRPRFTRTRRKWQLSWDYMGGSSYRTLRSFYQEARGGSTSFMWTHPTEQLSFTVRFNSEIESSNQSYDYWRVTVSIEEV
jgi:phage-related protein